jgi:hypothetical protein
MNDVIKYSAADLLKKSAMQLVFLKNKKEKIATKYQLKGNDFQFKVSDNEKSKNKGFFAEELRGSYSNENSIIFFCVDMISDGVFYEIKSIQDRDGNLTNEYPKWYLESSLLQCAFYKSLLIEGNNKTLYTPKFRLKEGFEFKAMDVDVNSDYVLIFGEKLKYKITVNSPKEIIEYYLNKINHLNNYEQAKAYDSKFKFKDFYYLSTFFEYTEIKQKTSDY